VDNLGTYDLPKLNQEDINNLNRSIMSNDFEAVIKSLSTKQSPETDSLLNSTRSLSMN
jgi:hypothetical protein